ncbi:MAG: MFS transporter [Methylomonas sp.]|nr:MAG: MFS transporter [Methylomonas sp.]
MINGRSKAIALVALGHYLASFTALGMPPFYGLLLNRSLNNDATFLAGWLYIIPTVCLAVSSSWWGRLADKKGRKLLLIRAQLGLALSFAVAGYAENLSMFVFALVLQGFLGGSFAAANAYLAGIAEGRSLAGAITLMQGSARAALLTAPPLLGWLLSADNPVHIYRYLALLPLAAAMLTACLPAVESAGKTGSLAISRQDHPFRFSHGGLLAMQFIFTFATVISFPYFIPHALLLFPDLTEAGAGLLFGMPHLLYLLCAALLQKRYNGNCPHLSLGIGFVLLALSLLAQQQTETAWQLSLWRVTMGAAMTYCFIGLHNAMAVAACGGQAGHRFGRFESCAKWATVAAGLTAGISVQYGSTKMPFLLGAIVLLGASVYLFGQSFKHFRLANS